MMTPMSPLLNVSISVPTPTPPTPTQHSGGPCPHHREFENLLHVLQSIVVPFLFAVIVLVGFCGNLLVLLVIWGNKQMRNSTNILIFSLALADMLFIVLCVPFTAVVYGHLGWPLGRLLCRIFMYSTYVSVYCSVYTLVAMSLDRYLAIVHPIASVEWRTPKNTILLVLLLWMAFLAVNVPLFLNSDVVTEWDQERHCTESYCHYSDLLVWLQNHTSSDEDFQTNPPTHRHMEQDERASRIFYTLFFFFAYLMPLIVICVLYGFLLAKLMWGRTSRMAQRVEAGRAKRRVTYMVVAVVAVFAGCWLPIQVVFLVQNYIGEVDSYPFRIFHVLANCFAYANSSVNPILYAFLSENFRRAFSKFLCLGNAGGGRLGAHAGSPGAIEFEKTRMPTLHNHVMLRERRATLAEDPDLPAVTPLTATTTIPSHSNRTTPEPAVAGTSKNPECLSHLIVDVNYLHHGNSSPDAKTTLEDEISENVIWKPKSLATAPRPPRRSVVPRSKSETFCLLTSS